MLVAPPGVPDWAVFTLRIPILLSFARQLPVPPPDTKSIAILLSAMSSPPKRIFMDQTRSSQAAADNPPSNGLDPDLLTRLRNVGPRVRKSESIPMLYLACIHTDASTRRVLGVTEGFPNPIPLSPDAVVTDRRLPFTQTPSFRSAKDTLRDVYSRSNSLASLSSSFNKRDHDKFEEEGEEDPLASDDDVNMLSDEAGQPASKDMHPRPTKPLRSARKRTTVTQSLPVGALQFSGGAFNSSASEQPIEEDWSEGNFAGPPQADVHD
ncbi:hypothetical protein A0H81_09920 [Grifola frondosa]|uniref:Uncharacterized protein n=1 Tax=Grifola frondosa TaxID=5627 RepID=A0A1C7M0D1_GRIFR|nr:hypothetical protein A0H81_09920 [Grifola frondosa]